MSTINEMSRTDDPVDPRGSDLADLLDGDGAEGHEHDQEQELLHVGSVYAL